MPVDQEKTQLILLRILGVLLIAVGFTMLARQVRSDVPAPLQIVEHAVFQKHDNGAECDRRVVHVHRFKHAEIPPMPPPPPTPPTPPVIGF